MFATIRNWRASRHQFSGDAARDRGDWLNATKHYRRVLHIDSRRAPILIQLGHALKEQGNWKEAEGQYRIAVEQNPSDPDACLHLGNALAHIDRSADAEAFFLRGMQRSEVLPDSTEKQGIKRRIHVAIADTARSTRDWKKAIRHYREALAIDSADAGIWVQLAHALKEERDFISSEVAYRRAVALDPLTVDTYVHLCHVITHRYRTAEQKAMAGTQAVEVGTQALEEVLASLANTRENVEKKLRSIATMQIESSTEIAPPPARTPRAEMSGSPAPDNASETPSAQVYRLNKMPVASSAQLLIALERAVRIKQPIYVSLPIIPWDVALFQRPQHMALAMARQGALSVYFTYEVTDAESRIVTDQCWLACPSEQTLSSLRGTAISVYSTVAHRSELWTMLRRNNRIVYEYIDHVDEAISGNDVPGLLRQKELAFSGGADIIVVSAKALEEEAARRVERDRIVLVPNGTDYEHYRSALLRNDDPPSNMAALKAKHEGIVGYFGAMAPWLWHEMLNELTASRPDLGFVFIGPDYHGGMDKIERRANVLMTGAIPYDQLPTYAKRFDVSIIPFRPGEIARTTSPLKLFEYFSLEKPVVVTDEMDECTKYPEVFRAHDTRSFSMELDRALARSKSPVFRERLRNLAMANTWDARAATLMKFTGFD